MSKQFRIMLSVALILSSLFISGCYPPPEDQSQSNSSPSASLGESYPDPFPAEAYTPWTVGELLDISEFDAAASDHEDTGTVYQAVYEQSLTPSPVMTKWQLYRYDNFPSFSNENQEADPVWFRGNISLYVFDNSGTDLPFAMEEYRVNIREPSLYALLEEAVFSLSFSPITEEPHQLCHTAVFITRDLNGVETIYTICRDGIVLRNDSEAAPEPLSEAVTAQIFALKYTHTFGVRTHCTYAYASRDFNPDDEPMQVVIRRDGQEIVLSAEDSQAFLALVSDRPGAKDTFKDYSFRCFVRCNSSVEDLGEPVLEFVLMQIYDDGTVGSEKTYTLHAGGKVSRKEVYGLGEYGGGDIPTLDQLLIDRWLISRTAFDVSPVLSFLDSLEQQSNP